MSPRPPRGSRLFDTLETLGRRALERRGFVRTTVPTTHGEMHALVADGSGDGPPILAVHGLGSACIDLAPLVLPLQRRARKIIVPDLPGHGWSAPFQTTQEMQEMVVEALDQLIDQPVVAVGNSLGGLVSVRWALARPELATGLVLLSPGGAPAGASDLDALIGSFGLASQKDALGFVDRLMAGDDKPLLRWLRAWGVRHRLGRPGPRALLAGASPDRLLTAEEVRSLTGPILVVWGREDDILPKTHVEFWKANLPAHATVEEPLGMGHSPYLDAPGRVVARIERFLQQNL